MTRHLHHEPGGVVRLGKTNAGFDPEAIMRDLVGGDADATLESFPSETPEANEIQEPGSTNIYLGRTVLGTEALVDEVLGQYPQVEIFSAEGRLVVPLMRRRLVPLEEGEDVLIEVIRKLGSRAPSVNAEIAVEFSRPTIRPKANHSVVKREMLGSVGQRVIRAESVELSRVADKFIPMSSRGYIFNTSELRIAETPPYSEPVARAIIQITAKHMPKSVNLSPVSVLKV